MAVHSTHLLLSLFRPADLEHIPERRYNQLIQRALLRRGDAAWIIPLAVGLLGALLWMGVGYGVAILLTKGTGATPNWTRIGFLNVVIASMITVAIASVVRWRLVTSSIRRLLNKAACPYCEFSLIGLTVEMGGVVCPECGERLTLSELSLTKEDLVPDTLPAAPFDGAGKLGSYTGQLSGPKKIKPDKRGNVKQKPAPTPSGGGEVML